MKTYIILFFAMLLFCSCKEYHTKYEMKIYFSDGSIAKALIEFDHRLLGRSEPYLYMGCIRDADQHDLYCYVKSFEIISEKTTENK